jgi:hypothetical protein
MITIDELQETVDDGEPYLQPDGFEDCLLGVLVGIAAPDTLVYDKTKILAKLAQQSMTAEEAQEYFDFNIAGAYVGPKTPVYLETVLP